MALRQMLLAPDGTPAAVIGRLAGAVRKILVSSSLAVAAAQRAVQPRLHARGVLGRDLVRECADQARVIKAQKIQAQ